MVLLELYFGLLLFWGKFLAMYCLYIPNTMIALIIYYSILNPIVYIYYTRVIIC